MTFRSNNDTMTLPTIIAQDLTYQCGDLVAVDHLSFEVAKGEALGFLGSRRNGRCLIPG
jgi:ABC-type multidrug transport system ATPase subunit